MLLVVTPLEVPTFREKKKTYSSVEEMMLKVVLHKNCKGNKGRFRCSHIRKIKHLFPQKIMCKQHICIKVDILKVKRLFSEECM